MHKQPLPALALAAIGVVFGDIGTSPLYSLKEAFSPSHGIPLTDQSILGVISLLFWAIVIVVGVKYVLFVMRADNNGEGGVLALMALALRSVDPEEKTGGPADDARHLRCLHVLRRCGDHARHLGDLGGRRPGDRGAESVASGAAAHHRHSDRAVLDSAARHCDGRPAVRSDHGGVVHASSPRSASCISCSRPA